LSTNEIVTDVIIFSGLLRNAITPDQSDTLFPEEISQTTARGKTMQTGYFTAKFQLVRLAKRYAPGLHSSTLGVSDRTYIRVLDEALRIIPSASTVINDLWIQL